MGSVAFGFDGSSSARVALSVGPCKSAILDSTPHKLLHIPEVPVLRVAAESAGSR
jgi:hypothetical protein